MPFITLHAQEDHMKSLDEESRVFPWGQVYRWAAIIGAILGGLWAIYFVNGMWSHDGGIEFIKQIMTVIVFLAVPVGAVCGAALAALLHFWIWCFVKVNEVWTRK